MKVIRKDIVLTKMASRIFGEDLVDCAYVTTWDYGNSKAGEVEKRLAVESYINDEPEIDNGAKDIIISFKNGKSVYFTNSEWGSIGAIDMNKETKES